MECKEEEEMVMCDNLPNAFQSFACPGGGGVSEIPAWKAFHVKSGCNGEVDKGRMVLFA